jgi:predicted ribonuclease YlaK
MAASRLSAAAKLLDEPTHANGPLATAEALGRTAVETCRQHERLSRLNDLGVSTAELAAAHALVDTIDLALAECVQAFEKSCAKVHVSDDVDVRHTANTLWLAAREYLRRHSIAERASQQLTHHDVEQLGVLKFEYELEASALLALRQATTAFGKLRADAR